MVSYATLSQHNFKAIDWTRAPLVSKMVLEIVNTCAADVARLEEQVSEALAKLTPEDAIDYSLANVDTLTKYVRRAYVHECGCKG